jgi:hypothetical protein
MFKDKGSSAKAGLSFFLATNLNRGLRGFHGFFRIPQGRGDAGGIFSFGVFGFGGLCLQADTT